MYKSWNTRIRSKTIDNITYGLTDFDIFLNCLSQGTTLNIPKSLSHPSPPRIVDKILWKPSDMRIYTEAKRKNRVGTRHPGVGFVYKSSVRRTTCTNIPLEAPIYIYYTGWDYLPFFRSCHRISLQQPAEMGGKKTSDNCCTRNTQ